MHNLIVHIPVWSSAAVPPTRQGWGGGGVQEKQSRREGGLFPTDTKTDCYKE